MAAAAQASVGGGAAEENNKIIPTFTTPTYSASGVRRPRGCIIKTRRHKLLLCARVHVPRGSPTYIYTHAHIHLPGWSRGSKQQCHQHARSGAFVEAAVQGQHEALSQQRVRGDAQCPRNAMQGEGGENTEEIPRWRPCLTCVHVEMRGSGTFRLTVACARPTHPAAAQESACVTAPAYL